MSTSTSQCWDLCRTHECCHGCCEFIRVSALSLRSYLLCIFYPHWLLHSASLSTEFPESWGEGFGEDIPFKTMCSRTSHSLTHYLVVDLCVSSNLLQQEASIMLAEKDRKYGNSRMLEVILLLCSFSRTWGLGFPLGPCLIILRFLVSQAVWDMGLI